MQKWQLKLSGEEWTKIMAEVKDIISSLARPICSSSNFGICRLQIMSWRKEQLGDMEFVHAEIFCLARRLETWKHELELP